MSDSYDLKFDIKLDSDLLCLLRTMSEVRLLTARCSGNIFIIFPHLLLVLMIFFLLIIIVFDVFKVFFKLQSLVSRFKHTHATSYRVSHIKECKLNLEICTFCENTTRFYEMFFTMYPI